MNDNMIYNQTSTQWMNGTHKKILFKIRYGKITNLATTDFYMFLYVKQKF